MFYFALKSIFHHCIAAAPFVPYLYFDLIHFRMLLNNSKKWIWQGGFELLLLGDKEK